MEDQEQAIVPSEENWRTRIFAVGGIIGAILGLLSAYLYIQAAEQKYGGEQPPETPRTGDAVRLGVSLMSIIRTITEWGSR